MSHNHEKPKPGFYYKFRYYFPGAQCFILFAEAREKRVSVNNCLIGYKPN